MTAQIIPLRYVPGDLFTWHKTVGVTEESTLEANGYNDFSRELTIKSHKTGKFMTFFFVKETLNEDGDVLNWRFESKDGVIVFIYND